MEGVGPGVTVLRLVLCLMPPAVRREYGAEILKVAGERRTGLGRVGAKGRLTFWVGEWVAGLWAVAQAWGDEAAGFYDSARVSGRWTMGGWSRDVGFAALALWRRPGIPSVVVVALAVGMGATMAIAELVDGLLLRPVELTEANRVVRVFEAHGGTPYRGTAYPTLQAYRETRSGIEGPAGFMEIDVAVRFGSVSERVSAGAVTGDYFEVLRLRPEVGRTLRVDDDQDHSPAVVVLGYGLWKRLFGGDASVVGRVLQLGEIPFTIVGVAPRGFQGVSLGDAPDLWIPLARLPDAAVEGLFAAPNLFDTRAFPWLSMVGRLEAGQSVAVVQDRLNATAAAILQDLGAESGIATDTEEPVRVEPASSSAVTGGDRDKVLRFLRFLGVVVALTLLVTYANAAHLMAARGWSRGREIAVRRALGATAQQIRRQYFAESLLVALAGGVMAVALSTAALRVLSDLTLPGGVPLGRLAVGVDGRLLLVALFLSVVTAVVSGVGPAMMASRRAVTCGFRETTAAGRDRGRTVQALLSAQVALSVLLVVGAMLFLRSLSVAFATDLGFQAQGRVALTLGFRGHGYRGAELGETTSRLLDQLGGNPMLSDAALATHVPVGAGSFRLRPIPEGAEEAPSVVHVNVVTPHYPEVLGIPIVQGRGFEERDDGSGPPVALVTESAAEALWPGEAPLGRTLVLLRGLPPITVVGVVADHLAHAIDEGPTPYIYLPLSQNSGVGADRVHLVARGADGADGRVAAAALREEVRTFDPTLPVQDVRVLQDQVRRLLMPQRFGGWLLGLLSAVAVMVTALGVYAMVTFAVRRRTREIGIRLAVGAGAGQIVAAVVGRVTTLVIIGLAVGLGGATAAERIVGEYLYGVDPLDPVSFAAGAAVLILGVVAAAAVPARDACAVDPTSAMRRDP